MGPDDEGTTVPEGEPVVDYAAVFASTTTPLLLLGRDLVVVAANPAYAALVRHTVDGMTGLPVAAVLASELEPESRAAVEASLRRVLTSGISDPMPPLHLDLVDDNSGATVHRHWSIENTPVLDDAGDVALVLHAVRSMPEASRPDAAETRASVRLAALADVALRLSRAESPEDVVSVITERGLSAIGAVRSSVAVLTEDAVLEVTMAVSPGQPQVAFAAQLPLDGGWPPCVAVRTGRRVLLADKEASTSWSAEMADAVAYSGCQAWAALPMTTGETTFGALTVAWVDAQTFTAADVELLDALGTQCGYALERIAIRAAEAQAAAAAVHMSEALQRSLLVAPVQPEGMQVVVRYRPAAQEAQVGGDWYDAFPGRRGGNYLVVGDVSGHDREAAATMGTVRNLLRAITYTLDGTPGVSLTAVDRAMRDLAVDALATAVLARVTRNADGSFLFAWSNAGHPPPMVLLPGGQTELLSADSDLILGLDADVPRGEHARVVPPGATVLLFTDGLFERRDASIEDGLAWLVQEAGALADDGLDALCDGLLERVAGHAEDDIALLAVRLEPVLPAQPSEPAVGSEQPVSPTRR